MRNVPLHPTEATKPARWRALLDSRGFTAAPRIGTPGQYVFERAFVEK